MRREREYGEVIFHREDDREDFPDMVLTIPYSIQIVDYCDTTFPSVDLDNTFLDLMTPKEIERLREEAYEGHVWAVGYREHDY